jgi:hypothetical protein
MASSTTTTTQLSKGCGEMADLLKQAQKDKKADFDAVERLTKAGYGKQFDSNVLVPYLDNEIDMAHYGQGWTRGRGNTGQLADGNRVAYAAVAADTYFKDAEKTYDNYKKGCMAKSRGMANSLNWDGASSDLVLVDVRLDAIANRKLNRFLWCNKTAQRIEDEKRQLDLANAKLNVVIPVTLQCQQCQAEINIIAGGNVNMANAKLQQAIDCVSKFQSGASGGTTPASSNGAPAAASAAAVDSPASDSGGTNTTLIVAIVVVVVMMFSCMVLMAVAGVAVAM